uniref:Uncharacterized protein n=1 Tax=Candidatus Methanophaga sp. ANME-1 ERB7 TaxID=2759913 RepID=A0A7G9Z871_9EURY|nr:hypothetical protein OHJJKADD_00028 [Methanosarcinales archaeon ANME-1 ERB7]
MRISTKQNGKCKSQRATDDDKETLAIEYPFRTDAGMICDHATAKKLFKTLSG